MTDFEVSDYWSNLLNLELDEHSIFPRPFSYFDPKWHKEVDDDGYVNDGMNPEHMHFAHIGVGPYSVKIEDRDGAFGIHYFPGNARDGQEGRFLKPDAETCQRLKMLMAVNGLQVLRDSPIQLNPNARDMLEKLPRQRAIYARLAEIVSEFDTLAAQPLGLGMSPYCLVWSLELDLAITQHVTLSRPKPCTRQIDEVVWTDICNVSARVGDPNGQMGLYWRSGNFHREINGWPKFRCAHEGTVAPVTSVMKRFSALLSE